MMHVHKSIFYNLQDISPCTYFFDNWRHLVHAVLYSTDIKGTSVLHLCLVV